MKTDMQAQVASKPDDSVQVAQDARIERTRARLAKAVLELASERDITTASVAELTRRARINRSTFYAHAQTPVELLIRVLSQELDAVRQLTFDQLKHDGLLLRDLTRITLRDLISHVMRHKAVYGSTSHLSSIYTLRVVLAEHIEQSVLRMFREGFVVAPASDASAMTLHAAFIAHGIAGAVEAWLRLPEPHCPDMLIASIEAMYPSWYAPDLPSSDRPQVANLPPVSGEIP